MLAKFALVSLFVRRALLFACLATVDLRMAGASWDVNVVVLLVLLVRDKNCFYLIFVVYVDIVVVDVVVDDDDVVQFVVFPCHNHYQCRPNDSDQAQIR